MLDLIVRGGRLVDGTGAPARGADIGIRAGRIASIGNLDADAREIIDVGGLTVAPGFIETHTHLDAQVIWDPTLSPIPLHGVTTVVGGNCGLTLGPIQPAESEKEWLMGLLASVEALPIEALREGIDFDWDTFGGYLDAIDKPLGANALFFVGHSALRRTAMGPDAAERAATSDEIEVMKSLLASAIEAGGFGLSTAGHSSHLDLQGKPTPPQFATNSEIVELAGVLSGYDGTAIQITPASAPIGFDDDDRQLLGDLAEASGRPVFWITPLINKAAPTMHERMLETCDLAAERGGQLYGLFLPTAGPFRQSFDNPFFMRAFAGTWGEVMTLPHEERLASLRDPDVRLGLRRSLEEADGHFSQPFKDKWQDHEVLDVDSPELEQYIGRNLAEIGREKGVDAFDAMLDIAVAGDLRVGFVSYDQTAEADPWMIETKQAVLRDERVVWGGSDAGAHVDAGVGADFPPRAIMQLVRQQGWFTLEEAVHKLTGEVARKWGIKDRGVLAEGNWADIVVFDPDTIAPGRMERRTDWPGGAWRLATASQGIDRVIVNGRQVVVDGEYTGELAGRLLRSGLDTATAAPAGSRV